MCANLASTDSKFEPMTLALGYPIGVNRLMESLIYYVYLVVENYPGWDHNSQYKKKIKSQI